MVRRSASCLDQADLTRLLSVFVWCLMSGIGNSGQRGSEKDLIGRLRVEGCLLGKGFPRGDVIPFVK